MEEAAAFDLSMHACLFVVAFEKYLSALEEKRRQTLGNLDIKLTSSSE